MHCINNSVQKLMCILPVHELSCHYDIYTYHVYMILLVNV